MTNNLTTPTGRILWGSLYTPNEKDFDGKPLTVKTGPQAGQPRKEYVFGLAIPKGPEQHWASTEWGAKIWAIGHAAFPAQAQRPDFAWKVTDGDSTVPNKNNRIPNKQEGAPGHWILRLGSSFAPGLFTLIGQPPNTPAPLLEANAIQPGFYVQVNLDCAGNGNEKNAGVYLNHRMVCLVAFGTVIRSGPDPSTVGFGQPAALPQGASLTPPAGGFTPPAPAAVPAPAPAPAYAPPPPVAMQQPPYVPPAPAPAAAYQPPPPAPVAAHPAVAPPPPPPAAAAPAGPQMTALAGGQSYQSFIGAGWTDAQLRQNGYIL